MESSELIAAWRYLDKGHCAFKSSATSPGKSRCNHLFTVTGGHKFSECPLIQTEFFSFQQQEDLVYLIEKNPTAVPASMWGFTELPTDREDARKIVEGRIKNLDEELKNAIWRRFEQHFDVADVIRTSDELAKESDEDLED